MASEVVYTCDRCGRKPNEEAGPDGIHTYPPGPLNLWRTWEMERRRVELDGSRGEARRIDLCSACDDELHEWLPRGQRLNHHHLPVPGNHDEIPA